MVEKVWEEKELTKMVLTWFYIWQSDIQLKCTIINAQICWLSSL